MDKDEDAIKTDPIAPRFDLVLLDVTPAQRMRIVDILMKVNLGRDKLTAQEALVLTFRLPSVLARNMLLKKALELETVFEVYGARVELRPTHKPTMKTKSGTEENGDAKDKAKDE